MKQRVESKKRQSDANLKKMADKSDKRGKVNKGDKKRVSSAKKTDK